MSETYKTRRFIVDFVLATKFSGRLTKINENDNFYKGKKFKTENNDRWGFCSSIQPFEANTEVFAATRLWIFE